LFSLDKPKSAVNPARAPTINVCTGPPRVATSNTLRAANAAITAATAAPGVFLMLR